MVAMSIEIWVTGILVLMMLSFMYKETLIYRIGEYTLIGASGGAALVGSYIMIKGNAVTPIQNGNYIYIIALILGLLTFTRFSKDLVWVSRYPVSILIGLGVGIVIPTMSESDVVEQIRDTIRPIPWNNPLEAFNTIFLIIVVISCLWFFIFTREPKYKAENYMRRFARLIIMASFGVTIGSTVMEYAARTLTALQLILSEWWQLALVEALKHLL